MHGCNGRKEDTSKFARKCVVFKMWRVVRGSLLQYDVM
jgi:hypothetical protein